MTPPSLFHSEDFVLSAPSALWAFVSFLWMTVPGETSDGLELDQEQSLVLCSKIKQDKETDDIIIKDGTLLKQRFIDTEFWLGPLVEHCQVDRNTSVYILVLEVYQQPSKYGHKLVTWHRHDQMSVTNILWDIKLSMLEYAVISLLYRSFDIVVSTQISLRLRDIQLCVKLRLG